MLSEIVIAQNEEHKLICRTNGLNYIPDVVKHQYGNASRRPLEDWFLDELRFFESKYPDYSIFTLGSTLVFGEKFITYLTICEFEIASEEDFAMLVLALKASDQAIRKKFHPMWKWDIAARNGNKIAFMVGWMDFAYFLRHRRDFANEKHGGYMQSFISDQASIAAFDFKVLRNGTIVDFDESKLSANDKEVFRDPNRIEYETLISEAVEH